MRRYTTSEAPTAVIGAIIASRRQAGRRRALTATHGLRVHEAFQVAAARHKTGTPSRASIPSRATRVSDWSAMREIPEVTAASTARVA